MEPIDAQWVFAYGSLIWNPEIDFEHAEIAQLRGYHRAFCIRSTRYRGTAEHPGIVLGLDRGGSCLGVAYRLRERTRIQAVRQLYDREMPGGVYVPRRVAVALPDGSRVPALAFVANHSSPSYARLSDDDILDRLMHCHGERGANRDYAINTLQSLQERGLRDARLARLVARL